MSEEKTLWRRSEGEQASPSASAELSKLLEEAGLALYEAKPKLHMYFNSFAYFMFQQNT
jgi:hypothetical protein